jgi:16S rRNA (guanine(966)-N(2))-methyltransferase RsmD
MRVIAGSLKGRHLKTPTWEGLRPTSDKLRETLFNILQGRVADARVLDGYAGTGALGIEALSRGAAHVTFIEHDRRARALIEANLAACRVTEGYTIESGDVTAVLGRRPSRRSGEAAKADVFDLILLDPPYDMPPADALRAAARCLAPDGIIVLERATRRAIEIPDGLVRTRDVVSGDSTLTFMTRNQP